MHPIGASIVALLSIVILFGRRRIALAGIMFGVLYLTQFLAIEVIAINVTAHRILALAGITRIVIRREFSYSQVNILDRSLLLVYGYSTLVFLIRSNSGQMAIVGSTLDIFLYYFVFRGLIRKVDDLKWLLNLFVVFLVPYVALLYVEMTSGESPFSMIDGGGTGEYRRGETNYREGRVRCDGSFRHSSLLGTLGASLLPLYMAMVFIGENKLRAMAGVGLCLLIVWFTNSGGPVSAAGVAIVCWLFWKARASMNLVRYMLVGVILLLALVMKAPIWYLPAKISNITGGDGWHRSYLMNVFIENFNQWWIAGMNIVDTREWFQYYMHVTGGADITNMFIRIGIDAGLFALVLFIFLIVSGFRAIGQAMKQCRETVNVSTETEYLLWGLGCTLTVHVANWFGITYFDQTYILWLMQLAAISIITHSCMEEGALNGFSKK